MILAGLRDDHPRLRHAALALLAGTAAKVFLHDLASLESVCRAASFVAVGVLMLAAAHAWQRLRPGALR